MTVKVLFPDNLDFDQRLAVPLARPFEDTTIQCLSALSHKLVAVSESRLYPELVALAYWLRPANLTKIAHNHLSEDRMYRPVGTVFHVAPANVETIFVYSGVVSLLMGNRNLIRVSSRRGPALDILLDALLAVQKENSWGPVLDRLLLVDFPRDSEILTDVSSTVDLRVLWGSNATIEQLRGTPIPPQAREICFPDKFSLCLLGAGQIVEADDLSGLVQGFANDAYLFAQQACSSPRCIVWLGDDEQVREAKKRFWSLLAKYLEQKGNNLLSAGEKYNSLAVQQLLAFQGLGEIGESISPLINRFEIETLNTQVESRHVGCGLFYELVIHCLDELQPHLRENHQTLSCWGVDITSLRQWLADNSCKGIDRVCRVGRALDFETVWDGVDLLAAFSRQMMI